MGDISDEFDDLISFIKSQPFKAIDIAVDVKATEDKHNVYVSIDQDEVDNIVLNAEAEAERRFRNIMALSTDSGSKR